MLTALRIVRDYWRVKSGRCERAGRPGRWRVFRKADCIVIEVFHDQW
jgi:hypothetical protein